MVLVKEVLEKLSPHLSYGKNIMNIDLGDVEFDTFKETGTFSYEFTNSKNPNIKLRIRDDFPFRLVLTKKQDGILYGTTWNGSEHSSWKIEDEERIKRFG